MRKLSMVFLLLCICAGMVHSQTVAVSGRITDGNGIPVPGASVIIIGTRNGTTANTNGEFSITAQAGQKLRVSALGFQPRDFNPGTNLSLQLARSEGGELSEVVVTALGIRKEKKALGYAVSTIDKKILEQRPDGDIARLLSGKAPGVDILATSGISGSGTNIQIRGANSITGGSDPLWIVDGTPVSGATNQQSDPIYGNQTSSRFMDIDPNNIESISVLKGLSATVLYGEQGKNGVILVTTKNGSGRRSAKKTEISVSQSYFITQPSSLPEMEQTYGGGFSLTGGFAFFSNWGPAFTHPYTLLHHPYKEGLFAGAFDYLDDSIEFRPHDNFKAIFKDGNVVNTGVNVSAALGQNGTLNASYSRLHDQGFLATNKVERNNFGIGINTKLLNNFTINGTINYVINDFKSPTTSEAGPSGAQSGGAGIFADVLYTPVAIDLGGWPYQTPDGASVYYRTNNDIQNPLWTLYNSITSQNTNRVFGNFSVRYNILKNLNLLYRVGYDNYTEDHALKINRGGVTRAGELEYTKGIYRTINSQNSIWDHSIIGQYNPRLTNAIQLDLTAGFNSNEIRYSQSGMKSTDQLVWGLFDHSNFINHDTKAEDNFTDLDWYSDQQRIGVFAQAGLSYNDYLFLNLGARNSWSSTLEKENRSKFYPSASVAWVPTSMLESLKGGTALNYIKLRAGYATSATFPDPYSTRPSLVLSTNDFFTRAGAIVNTNTISSFLANPNLKPELLKEFEAGLEAKLFANRVSIDFTWYDRKSSDQILIRPLDPSTGFDRTTINGGDLTNKGIELGIGFTPVKNKNFTWQIDGNFTRNKSRVSNLPEEISEVQTGGLFGNLGNYAINGQPFGVIKGSYWLRDEKTGSLIVGQDGYYISSTDTKIIADPNADFRLSAINTITYKSFEFRMQWDYQKGGQIYATSINTLLGRGLAKATDVDRTLAIILPGIKQDGTPNDFQTSIDRAYFNTYLGASEQFIYDATTIRLREMSLSFAFPKDLLEKTPFGALFLTLSGQNLWHYAPNFPEGSNYDPETSSGGVDKTRGFEFMTGPQTRRIGASLKVTF